MLEQTPSFDKLVHEFSRLPGVGMKTAQRLAYHLLKSPLERVENFREALRQVKEKIHECTRCFSFTEERDLCRLCTHPSRTDSSICVVEDPADISRIEGSGGFHGRYHVLHGTISPLDGVGPEELKISALLERVETGLAGRGPKIEEIILALDADLEGDTTVLYLAKILAGKQIKLTRIAHGVPIGGDIDYIDYRTLGRALENRMPV